MITRVGVGIIGFGTVGTGVVKILMENAALISRRIGVPIEIVRIADLDVVRRTADDERAARGNCDVDAAIGARKHGHRGEGR